MTLRARFERETRAGREGRRERSGVRVFDREGKISDLNRLTSGTSVKTRGETTTYTVLAGEAATDITTGQGPSLVTTSRGHH